MDYIKLSKELSYALRHAPWEYELELDEHGWVDISQLLHSLRENREWASVCEADLQRIIDASDKKRHEIRDGMIRALYGHSTPQKILREPASPPDVLYHGTAGRFLDSILDKGLLPQSRQFVHLSADTETALQVGRRRDSRPVLLVVDAVKAYREGVAFYRGNDKVWLADQVPSAFIHEE
jgi:putative RNA 2'-phosphotransferase